MLVPLASAGRASCDSTRAGQFCNSIRIRLDDRAAGTRVRRNHANSHLDQSLRPPRLGGGQVVALSQSVACALSRRVFRFGLMQRLHARWFRLATLSLAFCAGRTGIAHADTLTLAWDMNPEPEWWATSSTSGTSRACTPSAIDVGNAHRLTCQRPPAGQRYCFAVSAYFAGPVEGDRSPEVCTDRSGRRTCRRPSPTLATRAARWARRSLCR